MGLCDELCIEFYKEVQNLFRTALVGVGKVYFGGDVIIVKVIWWTSDVLDFGLIFSVKNVVYLLISFMSIDKLLWKIKWTLQFIGFHKRMKIIYFYKRTVNVRS